MIFTDENGKQWNTDTFVCDNCGVSLDHEYYKNGHVGKCEHCGRRLCFLSKKATIIIYRTVLMD